LRASRKFVVTIIEQISETSRRAPRSSAPRKPWAGGLRSGRVPAMIYAELRAQLLSLERLPGEPVFESQIAAAYGVSRTPVREAILKLADEGLIEIFPQSGTFVARIPLAALPEAIVIRKSLEETSARLAAHRASGSRVLALRAILERQREADLAGDRNVFHLADEAFHAAIADLAGYPGIWKLVLQVKAHVDRYRRLTLPQEGRMTRALGEHETVLKMIEAGDPTGAAAAMAAHLDGLLTDIPDIRRLNPDYFAEAKPAPP
jgi:GntR family transcriptional regulator, rspAB operon transcriptional repressor